MGKQRLDRENTYPENKYKKFCKKIWKKINHLTTDHIRAKRMEACKINTKQLYINNINSECLLNRTPGVNINLTRDCTDANGQPIKPDNINQEIWDFLTLNREFYRVKTEQNYLKGRNDIRCIRQSYGCSEVLGCPPDCPIPETCIPLFTGEISAGGDNLTVTFIKPNTGKLIKDSIILNSQTQEHLGFLGEQISGTPGETGVYVFQLTSDPVFGSIEMEAEIPCPVAEETGPDQVPPPCPLLPSECIPNPNNCNLFVPSKLIKTYTCPWKNEYDDLCEDGSNIRRFNHLTYMSFNLDVVNATCNLATRNITVLVHYAYKSAIKPESPVNPCTGKTISPEFSCADVPESDIVCGVLRYNCQQFGFTINPEIGENFSGIINIPTKLISDIKKSAPFDPNNVTGVFQMAIFAEDGLDIKDENKSRGVGNPPAGGDAMAGGQICFNGNSNVMMFDGNTKMTKDIQIGDKVMSIDGEPDEIEAITYQKSANRRVFKIKDLLITGAHRIIYEGKWIKAKNHPEAILMNIDTDLFNIVTKERKPIIVENIYCSTMGMFCRGSHNYEILLEKIWGSEIIIDILKNHPQWPRMELQEHEAKYLLSEEIQQEYLYSLLEDKETTDYNMAVQVY